MTWAGRPNVPGPGAPLRCGSRCRRREDGLLPKRARLDGEPGKSATDKDESVDGGHITTKNLSPMVK